MLRPEAIFGWIVPGSIMGIVLLVFPEFSWWRSLAVFFLISLALQSFRGLIAMDTIDTLWRWGEMQRRREQKE